eukprot:5254759-Lingulodinium_polyedra.AAC.1
MAALKESDLSSKPRKEMAQLLKQFVALLPFDEQEQASALLKELKANAAKDLAKIGGKAKSKKS